MKSLLVGLINTVAFKFKKISVSVYLSLFSLLISILFNWNDINFKEWSMQDKRINDILIQTKSDISELILLAENYALYSNENWQKTSNQGVDLKNNYTNIRISFILSSIKRNIENYSILDSIEPYIIANLGYFFYRNSECKLGIKLLLNARSRSSDNNVLKFCYQHLTMIYIDSESECFNLEESNYFRDLALCSIQNHPPNRRNKEKADFYFVWAKDMYYSGSDESLVEQLCHNSMYYSDQLDERKFNIRFEKAKITSFLCNSSMAKNCGLISGKYYFKCSNGEHGYAIVNFQDNKWRISIEYLDETGRLIRMAGATSDGYSNLVLPLNYSVFDSIYNNYKLTGNLIFNNIYSCDLSAVLNTLNDDPVLFYFKFIE